MSDQKLSEFLHRCRSSPLFSSLEIYAARAPGRLDVMGGIADYSGSLVLEMPIRESTYVAVQAREDLMLIVQSGDKQKQCNWQDVNSIAAAREYFSDKDRWAAYLLGCVAYLAESYELNAQGLNIAVDSEVPIGKGVSSSAALEVACMRALAAHWGIDLKGAALARACQRVENEVVGAPCGLMDQLTSVCGGQGQLLQLLCQPDQIQGRSVLPEGLRLWGIDSGIRHEVGGSDYSAVRCAAFMGHSILLAQTSLGISSAAGKYLVNVGTSCWAEWQRTVPELLQGSDFLDKYGKTMDKVTEVDPDKEYAVRVCTQHPILEHQRVQEYVDLISSPADRETYARLGQLMFQAHESYSACGLGSGGTDELVNEVCIAQSRGAVLFGAKISGGGSGGTVVVLSDSSQHSVETIEEIAFRYRQKNGHGGYLFKGSAPGAMESAVLISERASNE